MKTGNLNCMLYDSRFFTFFNFNKVLITSKSSFDKAFVINIKTRYIIPDKINDSNKVLIPVIFNKNDIGKMAIKLAITDLK